MSPGPHKPEYRLKDIRIQTGTLSCSERAQPHDVLAQRKVSPSSRCQVPVPGYQAQQTEQRLDLASTHQLGPAWQPPFTLPTRKGRVRQSKEPCSGVRTEKLTQQLTGWWPQAVSFPSLCLSCPPRSHGSSHLYDSFAGNLNTNPSSMNLLGTLRFSNVISLQPRGRLLGHPTVYRRGNELRESRGLALVLTAAWPSSDSYPAMS